MKPDTTPKPVIYTTEKGLPKGGRYANPQYFDAIKQDAPKVVIVGNWPAVAEAYRRVGIPVEYIDSALDTAATGIVRHNTPADKAADPNAPLTTAKGPGGRWFVKRGNEIVTGPFETEADAKKAAGIEGSKIDLGTDSGDQFSDEQLRAAIETATGEKVHHKTGREKLVARFNEINAAAAARQDETAANGLTRREIEADLESAKVEFDPRDSVEDLAALRDIARE